MLVLFWENPVESLGPVASKVRISREMPDGTQSLIARDATWGCYIDPEVDDVCLKYEIEYASRDGNVQLTVPDEDVERYVLGSRHVREEDHRRSSRQRPLDRGV